MPVDLSLHGRPVGTVFDLLGKKENDITYSVGWAMSQSEELAEAFIEEVLPAVDDVRVDMVLLQQGIPGAGFTDIELKGKSGDREVHVVIEAKRGYDLPEEAQLAKYATRTEPRPDALVVMAEASADFVVGKLPTTVADVPVLYRSWRRLDELVVAVAGRSRNHAAKRLLRDLSRYLRGLMTMQNVNSNLVYVVSLGGEIEDTGISSRDVVLEHDNYFCPVGGGRGGWPKERRTTSASASAGSCSRSGMWRDTGSPTTIMRGSSRSKAKCTGPGSRAGSFSSAPRSSRPRT
jgi:hypothetical protein